MKDISSSELIEAVAESWSLIARRLEEHPFLSPQEVLNLLAISECELTELEDQRMIIALRFDKDFVRYPTSQFDMSTKVIRTAVPDLLEYLGEFDDLLQLAWLTTYQAELDSLPIEALKISDMAETLVELA